MDSGLDRISRGLASTSSRRQALKMLSGGLVGGALAGVGLSAANNVAVQPAAGGTATISDTAGALLGTVTDLVATLTDTGDIDISGTFTDTVGNVTEFVTGLLNTTGSCQILDLVLGPLELNLLGTVVTLATVHLNITTESGPGNLLRNLLCAVVHLLDSNGSGNALTNLLSRIFGRLG